MQKGYVIIAKNYKAEICELTIENFINTPDDITLVYGFTKYGYDYYKSGDVKPVRKMLEKECEELNKALGVLDGTQTSLRSTRRQG